MLNEFQHMLSIKMIAYNDPFCRIAAPICENKPVVISIFASGLLFAAFLQTKLCSLLPDYNFHAPCFSSGPTYSGPTPTHPRSLESPENYPENPEYLENPEYSEKPENPENPDSGFSGYFRQVFRVFKVLFRRFQGFAGIV